MPRGSLSRLSTPPFTIESAPSTKTLTRRGEIGTVLVSKLSRFGRSVLDLLINPHQLDSAVDLLAAGDYLYWVEARSGDVSKIWKLAK